jgi:S-adenosylmethionine:tRNA ribosyltransferase-isomerase
LIASRPAEERDGARLLVLDEVGHLTHAAVRELDRVLPERCLLVVNDTRVVPARLLGRKEGSGGRVEIFLERKLGVTTLEHAGERFEAERWRCLGRASKPLREGAHVIFDPGPGSAAASAGAEARILWARILSSDVAGDPGGSDAEPPGQGGARLFEVCIFSPERMPLAAAVEALGHIPLPPYIHRADDEADRARYQTVFARVPGAVAAPTAGLHLSEALLARLAGRGVEVAPITLHVGLGTFQPVTALDLDDHPMHAEVFSVPAATAAAVDRARARGAAVVAVGTTAVRALESAADRARPGAITEAAGETRLLIQPGYAFQVVDSLLTNFHLPQSTLLALVCAFGGRDRVLAAYRAAITAKYRFYSYGDAMLIQRPISAPGQAVIR